MFTLSWQTTPYSTSLCGRKSSGGKFECSVREGFPTIHSVREGFPTIHSVREGFPTIHSVREGFPTIHSPEGS